MKERYLTLQPAHGHSQCVCREHENHKHSLDGRFDNSLAQERGTKEGREWNQEVPTSDSCKVKQRVGDRGTEEDAKEPKPFHALVDHQQDPLLVRNRVWLFL